jgi:hypothetical protein
MPVVVAGAILALVPWAWQRSGGRAIDSIVAAGVVLVAICCSAMSGWDPARAAGEMLLLAAVVSLIWLASRSRPPDGLVVLLALGLAGLAAWGLWQVFTIGSLNTELIRFAEPARAYVEERLANRRAFASMPLPSHLAVLLATVLPILVVRTRATAIGMAAGAAAVLAVAGIIATRSPVGLGLALASTLAVVARRSRRLVLVGALLFVAALAMIVATRPDVGRMEPVALRIDNWATAVWLWTTSPASGVGVASFAQASQAAPLAVGNRPAHAHGLPFEALAELGPIGVVGAVTVFVCLLMLVRRLWPRQPALAAAIVVIPLHNLVDFSFFVSGVALPWAVLVGWAGSFARTDRTRIAPRPQLGRAVAVTVASLALAVTVLHATSLRVEQAASGASEPRARFQGALRALRLAPWRVEPQFLIATSAIQSGDKSLRDRAWTELDRHRWLRPRSEALATRRARLALARGDVSSSLAELWTASEYGGDEGVAETTFRAIVSSVENPRHDR